MKKSILLIVIICSQFAVFSQTKLAEKYNLMPWPKEIKESVGKFIIKEDFTISITSLKAKKVTNATIKFLRRLSGRTGVFIDAGFPSEINEKTNISLKISFDKVVDVVLGIDESYTLQIDSNQIKIHANTDVGAIRGIETLLQLVSNNDTEHYFPSIIISDSPRFVWRGLMIDVARHFQPINVIKRNLDAMASVKMNVFHWHLTDDHGFRVESKVYPKLQELASDGLFYTHEQIRDVVNYATNLGIRVIPEFDVPGHASAILTAYPELGSKRGYEYSIERFAGIFNPTLDPTKDITYEFLENLFTEIAPLFPDEYFHIGGDENEGKHWDESDEIQEFKKAHGLKTNHDLQTYFNIKLEKILKKLNKKLMGWDEIMTSTMPTTAVIHSWRGKNEGLNQSTLIEATKKGYKTVLSNGYYIDRLLSVEHHYSIDPIGNAKLTKEEQERILGGEATMWSELVTPLTIDSRIWPRTAAIAERFWSAQNVNDVENMKKRLKDISFKLEELGITHLKNRDVILRNISNNEDITALKTLSKVCEPLKIYSRNAGGTEYKTFSPFTLFADACTADAVDAIIFNNEIDKLCASKDIEISPLIKSMLRVWSKNHDAFLQIAKNPKINKLESLSFNVSKASKLLLSAFENEKISEKKLNELERTLEILDKPFEDIELVIVTSLKKMAKFCENKY